MLGDSIHPEKDQAILTLFRASDDFHHHYASGDAIPPILTFLRSVRFTATSHFNDKYSLFDPSVKVGQISLLLFYFSFLHYILKLG